MLYWAIGDAAGYVNRSLVLTHARKTHLNQTTIASSYVYVYPTQHLECIRLCLKTESS